MMKTIITIFVILFITVNSFAAVDKSIPKVKIEDYSLQQQVKWHILDLKIKEMLERIKHLYPDWFKGD